MQKPELGEAVPVDADDGDIDDGEEGEDGIEHELKQWVTEKVDAEVSRAVGLGQRVIKLPVKK
eukprot:5438481-Prymnesium_polylepis.3